MERIQAGSVCSGSRSETWRSISKEVEPAAEDDRGAEGERRDAVGREQPLDLEPGGEVLAEPVLGDVGDDPGEVDDAPHAGGGGGLGEVAGALGVTGRNSGPPMPCTR